MSNDYADIRSQFIGSFAQIYLDVLKEEKNSATGEDAEKKIRELGTAIENFSAIRDLMNGTGKIADDKRYQLETATEIEILQDLIQLRRLSGDFATAASVGLSIEEQAQRPGTFAHLVKELGLAPDLK